MRKAKFTVIAGAIGAAAVLSFSGPVEAGTCQPVDAKGKGKISRQQRRGRKPISR
jgi:hypothetical protein